MVEAAKQEEVKVNNNIAAAVEVNINVSGLQVFSYTDIEKATKGFSFENKLGEGGFGPVYKVSFSGIYLGYL